MEQESGPGDGHDPRATVVDVTYQQERLTGGIVDAIQFLGGTRQRRSRSPWASRFQQVKATEEAAPPRLVLEFLAAAAGGPSGAARGAEPAAGAAPRPPRPGGCARS